MSGTYSLTTFGCQMNKSDSERLRTILNRAGLRETVDEHTADLHVYNTCSVRQKSEDRMYGLQVKFEEWKRQKPSTLIAVTGCMPGRDKEGHLRERLPSVDFFFPTEEMIMLPRWISEINTDLIDSRSAADSEYEHYLKIQPLYQNVFQSFIPISNGCNKFCTYCVVPYSRGRQKDRSLFDVVVEAQKLAENGCKEITLLGQTVNLYRPADYGNFSSHNPYPFSVNAFPALLWELNQIQGLERIHFTAPHPQYMDDALLEALTLPKQVNYLHLPVQSGSNAVLSKMNRPYTAEYYCERIARLKQKMPSIAIGTDIIVGFCGETEYDFQKTVDLYQFCQFDIAYLAMYSMRSGTVAYRSYIDDVPAVDKKRRWLELQKIMEGIVLEKNQLYIGKTVSVLVDDWEKGYCSGNSREMKRVRYKSACDERGTIVKVYIERALEWMLYGRKTCT